MGKLFSFYANLTDAIVFRIAITELQTTFNMNYEECTVHNDKQLRMLKGVGYKYLAFQKPDNEQIQ